MECFARQISEIDVTELATANVNVMHAQLYETIPNPQFEKKFKTYRIEGLQL